MQVESQLQATRARQASVLIVDDADDVRDLYGEYLNFCGFRVLTARDGLEAIAVVEHSHPDIILMDLSMPRLDGWETIRQLKAQPRTSEIPVVAISAFASGEAASRAIGAGAAVCLPKPCLPSQVARAINALLPWRRSAAAV